MPASSHGLNTGAQYEPQPDDSSSLQRPSTASSGRHGQPVAAPTIEVDPWHDSSSPATTHDRRFDFDVGSETSSQSAALPGRRNLKKYLSPLRSRRYEGLRSSLSTPEPSRIASVSALSSERASPGMLNAIDVGSGQTPSQTPQTIKWSKLRKICDLLYSERSLRLFGRPTTIKVAGFMLFGSSRGLLAVFDFRQDQRHVIGRDTAAMNAGAITSLAVSADGSFVASGHVDGSIFVWDLSKPTTPTHHITPRKADLPATQGPDGHVHGTPVLFLDFVGQRHSILVSGDARGMAFLHRFRRRAIFSPGSSHRLLGRYPLGNAERMRPSFLYGCTILPSGYTDLKVDKMGLLAMHTPYKLVIATVNPDPRTQYTMTRPTGAIAESDCISACCAWRPPPAASQLKTDPTLVFAWCCRLYILDATSSGEEPNIQLTFASRHVHDFDESIIAIHWHDRDTICLLLQSWTVCIYDLPNDKIIASNDLSSRFLQPQDLAGGLLTDYFEQREAEYTDQAFAPNFGSCFTAYKGRIFLLGGHEMAVGSLHTWLDRVTTLVEAKQPDKAIVFMLGLLEEDADLRGTTLPNDVASRKRLVEPKLISIARDALAAENAGPRMVPVVFELMLRLERPDDVFEDLLSRCHTDLLRDAYFECLSKHILSGALKTIPPPVMRDLVDFFRQQRLYSRMEDIICRVEPACLDIDQVWTICMDQHLYDALAHVSTRALRDWITPLTLFFTSIKSVIRLANLQSARDTRELRNFDLARLGADTIQAVKIFRYLSLSMTGRTFPAGEQLTSEEAGIARRQLYGLLFSETSVRAPAGLSSAPNEGQDDIIATRDDLEDEPTFPYLRLLLHFDPATFFVCLDDLFEDESFNGDAHNGELDRQYIVNLLLSLMGTTIPGDTSNDGELPIDESGFDADDRVFLHMFLARNVPKYPQFVVLPISTLEAIVLALCRAANESSTDDLAPSRDDLRDDLEFSVESLLSIFRPIHLSAVLEACRRAHLPRVLRKLYRDERDWHSLVSVAAQDTDQRGAVFDMLESLLAARSSPLTRMEMDLFEESLVDLSPELVDVDATAFSNLISHNRSQLHLPIIRRLGQHQHLARHLYTYMRPLHSRLSRADDLRAETQLTFLKLMTNHDPAEVVTFLSRLTAPELAGLDVDAAMEAFERKKLVDAEVQLLGMLGRRSQALERLCNEFRAITTTLPAANPTEIDRIAQHIKLAAGLCSAQVAVIPSADSAGDTKREGEAMWVLLLLSVSALLTAAADHPNAVRPLRRAAENAVSRLLVDAIDGSRSNSPTSFNFLKVLRHLSPSPQHTSLALVLPQALAHHAYHNQLMSLATAVVERESFTRYARSLGARRRGWSVCVDGDGDGLRCSHCGTAIEWTGKPGDASAAGKARRREIRKIQVLANHNLPPNHQDLPQHNTGHHTKHIGKGKGRAADGSDDSVGVDDGVEGEAIVVYAGRKGELAHLACVQHRRPSYADDATVASKKE
ncbi:Vacuolar protein sorting-associated protein 8 [Savitreella phatthalungensis]